MFKKTTKLWKLDKSNQSVQFLNSIVWIGLKIVKPNSFILFTVCHKFLSVKTNQTKPKYIYVMFFLRYLDHRLLEIFMFYVNVLMKLLGLNTTFKLVELKFYKCVYYNFFYVKCLFIYLFFLTKVKLKMSYKSLGSIWNLSSFVLRPKSWKSSQTNCKMLVGLASLDLPI